MPLETFTRRSPMPVPAEFLFDWHTRPETFKRLTPPWERVEVGEMSHGITDGSRGRLVLKVGPIQKSWIAEIQDVEPGRQFRDVQISGPFASWVHTHRMIPDGEHASNLEDHIEYQLPLGTLGRIGGAGFVRQRLERLFAYRHRVTRDDVTALYHQQQSSPEIKAMKILVSGLSGLVGTSLGTFLRTGGHEVVGLSRSSGGTDIRWDPMEGEIDKQGLAGTDAVVHLAGENIAKRWTDKQKRLIRDSRVRGTTLLCESLAELPSPPKVLVMLRRLATTATGGRKSSPKPVQRAKGFCRRSARSGKTPANPPARKAFAW